MSAYKNIPLFDEFDTQDFLVWRELVLSYQDAHNPETAQLLRSEVFDELGGLGVGSAGVDPGDEENGDDAAEAEQCRKLLKLTQLESLQLRWLERMIAARGRTWRPRATSAYFWVLYRDLNCCICVVELRCGLQVS
jgi:hypothetical protein